MTRTIAALLAIVAIAGLAGPAVAQYVNEPYSWLGSVPLAKTSTGKLMLIPAAMSIVAVMLTMLPLKQHRRMFTTAWSTAIMAASTIAYLPIAHDLIVRARLWSPNATGDARIAEEALAIACLPVLLGSALTVWSIRCRDAGLALVLACAASAGIAALTFEYKVTVDFSRR